MEDSKDTEESLSEIIADLENKFAKGTQDRGQIITDLITKVFRPNEAKTKEEIAKELMSCGMLNDSYMIISRDDLSTMKKLNSLYELRNKNTKE